MAPPRILVADDDCSMRELLCEEFASWGCETVSASSVDDALGFLALESVELVLSDVHMPPGDGFQLLAAVRSAWPKTVVVLMSSFPSRDTERRALQAGARAFLSKPFSLAALREALEKSLAQGG